MMVAYTLNNSVFLPGCSAVGDHLYCRGLDCCEKRCGVSNTCLTDLMPKLWGSTCFLCFGVLSLKIGISPASSVCRSLGLQLKKRTDILCKRSRHLSDT